MSSALPCTWRASLGFPPLASAFLTSLLRRSLRLGLLLSELLLTTGLLFLFGRRCCLGGLLSLASLLDLGEIGNLRRAEVLL